MSMRSTTFTLRFLPLCAVLALAACGNDPQSAEGFTFLKDVASKVVGKPSAAPSQGMGLTRALLDTVETPVDLVVLEKSGAQALIAQVGSNNGVETWATVDKKSLSFKQKVLVASRGLGPDLMMASVPSTAQLSSGGQSFRRSYVYLTGDNHETRQDYSCTTAALGAATITIVEKHYATSRIQETCSGAQGRFTNDYWFQPGGKLRQSRQRISSDLGHIVIQHLAR